MHCPRLLSASWILLALSSCHSTPTTQEQPPALGGQSSVWPPLDADHSSPSDTQNPGNPWLAGWGGASQTDQQTAKGDTGSGPSTGTNSHEPDDETTPPGQGLLRVYWESVSADKLLGIENIGAFDIEDCTVEIYSNGSSNPWRNLALDQTIPPGAIHTLCLTEAFHPACNQVFGGSAFNGDDALVLRCRGTIHDSLGQVGHDPGDAWESAALSTRDQSLFRCSEQPDLTPDDVYVPDDWIAWDPNTDFATAAAHCASLGAGGMGGATPR